VNGHVTGPGHLGYRPDIDGLRALAILPVLAFHAFPGAAPGGFIGVDVFFVISGYLISSIIFAALESGRFTFRWFYARRIKRIFPALGVVLLVTLALGYFQLFADDYAALGKHVAGGAGFVANFLFWKEAGYFDAASDTKPLLHLWSLGVEEQFYLFWPAFVYLAWKSRVPHLVIVTLLLATSFVVNVVQVRSDQVAAFYSPLTRLWELLLGGALACVSRPAGAALLPARVWTAIATYRPLVANLAASVGLIAVVAAIFVFDAHTSFPGWRAALPTVGTLLVLAAGPDAWINRRLLSWPVLVWIGLISYPLYLWHWPLLTFARIAESATPSPLVRGAALIASVVLAWGTYALIERRVRFRTTSRAAIPALCAVMMVAGIAGYVTFAADGFVDRPINRSDQAHFLTYYDRMHRKGGLKSAYRWECDFMDWDAEANRTAIDASCTEAGNRGTVFLWGDSYAQSLSLGLRTVLPEGIRLAQVTTSLCAPRLKEADPEAIGGRCSTANGYAQTRIAALKPETVVLAQVLGHLDTDWEAMAAALHASGVRQVVLVGPSPQWLPSLPLIVTRYRWNGNFDRVTEGLNQEMFTMDRALGERLRGSTAVRYVSLIGALCNPDGCVATVPGSDRQLIAVDAGHLSPAGSVYVAETVLRPFLPTR